MTVCVDNKNTDLHLQDGKTIFPSCTRLLKNCSSTAALLRSFFATFLFLIFICFFSFLFFLKSPNEPFLFFIKPVAALVSWTTNAVTPDSATRNV